MDGDIFLYVKKNDVCVCSTVLREAAVTLFCQQLFSKAGLGDEATKFDLQKVGDADRLKLINKEGVKEIDLAATLDEATSAYVKRASEVVGLLGGVGKQLSAILGKDKAALSSNINVRVVLKTDERMKNGRALGEKHMKAMAKELAEGDDDYVIVTRTGQRISQDEIYIREKVGIERHGKSVDRGAAWGALKAFHDKLSAAGIAL